MKRSATIRRAFAGFTLVELMVGLAIGSVVLAGLSLASISLQRSFEAANYQMTAQNDQLRILDYVSRDLHLALKVQILNGDGKISVTVPADGSGTVNLQLGPLLGTLSGAIPGSTPTPAATKLVSYYVEGGEFIRDQDGVQTILADTVAEVHFVRTGLYVNTKVVFTPRFSASATAAAQLLTQTESCTLLRNATVTN